MYRPIIVAIFFINLAAHAKATEQDLNADQLIRNPSQCILDLGLNERDFDLTIQQYIDWNAELGVFLLLEQDSPEAFREFSNTDHVEPYRDMPLERLKILIGQEDRLAMIAALQRTDVDIENQERIANELFLLGDTIVALRHKMIVEIASAGVNFEIEQTVSPETKQHVKNALAYVSYGIQRKSLGTLYEYITFTNEPDYNKALHHSNILNDKDYEDIRLLTEEMILTINSHRDKENYQAIDNIDLPKVATTGSNLLLAISYLEYPSYLESLKLKDQDGELSLAKNQCVEEYILLLSDTGFE
ncbi:hypothetical protein ISG33_13290 [Glaciecola sp. MH2013]|uniref:hypothetical protein n=1 Tax=Glaciecola sp. MH2013 TaxID=2785524 RepID=UPI00189E3075|nr:hypothetical protein [Glaciecola sp. MH2013]MBF7074374.1 hypothetical protein [Glaciecola sp. MH2013]